MIHRIGHGSCWEHNGIILLWFICLFVCMSCFMLCVLCIVIWVGGAREFMPLAFAEMGCACLFSEAIESMKNRCGPGSRLQANQGNRCVLLHAFPFLPALPCQSQPPGPATTPPPGPPPPNTLPCAAIPAPFPAALEGRGRGLRASPQALVDYPPKRGCAFMASPDRKTVHGKCARKSEHIKQSRA